MAKGMQGILKNSTSWINNTLDFRNVLKSRLVLYFFFVLSVVNLFTFVTTKNEVFAAVFLLVGFLTSFFSKNMIVIMIFSLAITNILKYQENVLVQQGSHIEGMEDMENMEDMVEDHVEEPLENETDTSPSLSAPSLSAPSLSAPSLSAPSLSAPSLSAPSLSAPSLSAPSLSAPPSSESKTAELPSDIKNDLNLVGTTDLTDTANKMKKAIQSIDKTKQVDPETKKDFKNVLELQLKLLTGMTELQPIMQQVQSAMKSLKDKHL
jgi:uncharacterized membrane protein YphA (DoxX/SURF4 family)